MQSKAFGELPDPLRSAQGVRLTRPDQWPARRREIAQLMLPLAYGPFPAAPSATRCIALHAALLRRFQGARLLSCRVDMDGGPGFGLRLFVPGGKGPFAAIVSGDGCWRFADDAALAAVLEQGYVFAEFNRVEIAPDPGGPASNLPMVEAAAGSGALAHWAWGYHRVVDALLQLDWIDPQAIAVVGHSRGGKAALLAGATDERIALTCANNSGAGGAGCFRWLGPGAESLADITGAFGHWFGAALQAYAGREHELPFDQHFLKALVAPRALLTTEALDDAWANPQGSWQTQRAAACVFDLLGASQQQATVYRAGGHDHQLADWRSLLDFADFALRGKPASGLATPDPYPGLPLPGSWMARANPA